MDYRNRALPSITLALAFALWACDEVSCPTGTSDIDGRCTPTTGSDEGSMIGADGVSDTSGSAGSTSSNGMQTTANGNAGSGVAASGAAANGGAANGAAASGGPGAGGAAAASSGGSGTPGSGACGTETCDNQDNDCDQKIDEGVTRPCGPSMAVGICKPGAEACTAGMWTGMCLDAVEASMETCDVAGLDENCSGTANEDCACTPGMTQPCGMKGGNCVQGTQTCGDSGQWSDECVGAVPPETEVCEGAQDENCDGRVDEGCECTNGKTMDCGMDVGECAMGKKTCMDGKWGATCEGERKPGTESCDGKDNNCDGAIDENLLNDCGGCNRLSNPPGTSCSAGESACRQSGTYECSGREATTCNARARSPTSERCDSADNDCDGSSDEGLENACGGSCLVRLDGNEGDSCQVSGAAGCKTGGQLECSFAGALRCVPKCWYLCVRGEAAAVRTQDPCGWTGDNVACAPEDPSCF